MTLVERAIISNGGVPVPKAGTVDTIFGHRVVIVSEWPW
jgi:hypothetical protein